MTMLVIKESNFLKSIVELKDRPIPLLPEFAFAGRSNVGKSSLINCLLNRKNIAHVSKQPGKTRTLNYFSVNEEFYLVDLPGYGYAKVPIREKEKWRIMIENYLTRNEYLVTLFVLIDAFVGMQKNDSQLLDWLLFERVPFKLIMTKADKISNNVKAQRLSDIRKFEKKGRNIPTIFFSAKSKAGREEVLSEIGASFHIRNIKRN